MTDRLIGSIPWNCKEIRAGIRMRASTAPFTVDGSYHNIVWIFYELQIDYEFSKQRMRAVFDVFATTS